MLYVWLAAIIGTALWAAFSKSRARLLAPVALLTAGLAVSLAWIPAIRASAEHIAADRPYCLALPRAHRPVQSLFDQSLFIARGDRLTPHLMLWVQEGEAVLPYSWSYYRGAFVEGLPLGTARNCSPRPRFLSDLRPAEDGMYFGIGNDLYIIPVASLPDHLDDAYLSFRLAPDDTLPVRSASVAHGPEAIRRWRERNSIAAPCPARADDRLCSALEDGGISQSCNIEGLVVQIAWCDRQGVYRLGFVSDDLLFDLHLIPTSPERIAGVKSAFEARWQRFRRQP